jgi:tRNA (cytidine/uridine-2'-O-)-methyltransferase
MQIVLVHPQIPPNTGNVGRLCAAVRLPLHLVEPLGFDISDRHLKRAGLDYWEYVQLYRHSSLRHFLEGIPASSLHFFSKKAQVLYTEITYKDGDYLVFGSETKGLPGWLFDTYPGRFRRIPIFEKKVRSLNLSNSVAIITYEALRQLGRCNS